MELLKSWVNETLPPSCGRRVEDFEADMANGYLLAELLDLLLAPCVKLLNL